MTLEYPLITLHHPNCNNIVTTDEASLRISLIHFMSWPDCVVHTQTLLAHASQFYLWLYVCFNSIRMQAVAIWKDRCASNVPGSHKEYL